MGSRGCQGKCWLPTVRAKRGVLHSKSSQKEWSARTERIPGGLRLTVVAKNPDDARTVARIRGLGFIGLLVQGAHRQPHHLAMARGDAIAGHGH